MDKYIVKGGKKLYGEVEISGAKNAAVAIIPAALMIDGVCRIENIPEISDTNKLFKILEIMGAKVKYVSKGTFDIDCTNVHMSDDIFDLTKQLRASYYLVGSMLGRFGVAKTTMPGGCNFGVRPIDQHIKGIKALSADIDTVGGFIQAKAVGEGGRLIGNRIYMDKVSVGATINVMLTATLAKGVTVIENVAREPHIVDLANFLNSMGADIRGAGTDVIKIKGVDKLHGGNYCLIPDQIEAGTYMAEVAAAGGEVTIKNVIPKHLDCISNKLEEMGVEIIDQADSVVVKREGELVRTNVKTQPYPGFPTDMQPQISAALCVATGTSVVTEAVWDNRYKYMNELRKMGAEVQVDGKTAVIDGPYKLVGAPVAACDLRAGAAMVIAGLCAEGTTEIEDVHYIERGYEDFVRKLRGLGADIVIVTEPDEPAGIPGAANVG
ncbi:MAG: UDP-N-acetylglucosamine 1-carboxyvinyltransferase [Oscillospiraceae bacterium]|nr:UDP-N-acetylglucosamine 1-carboxyvinyltransferase [Oscillospiraceae bacterium]